MKVVRAKILGFCSGVKRAIDIVYASSAAEKPVYTLGPLIHNPQVLEELRQRGIKSLDENELPEDLRGVSVIIRAHGIGPRTETELRKRGAAVIDATCPKVKASQLKAEEFAAAGYRLFLAGEKHHAEIKGIRGYARPAPNPADKSSTTDKFLNAGLGAGQVVSNAAEAGKAAAALYEKDPNAKTAIIGQTTISAGEYRDICTEIARFFPRLEIAQTICAATEERQNSLRQLADNVDAVIIAGGKDSANTRRLVTIAQASGKPCALAETPEDIPPDFFRYGTIGLASGTSTPDTLINAIEAELSNRQPGKNINHEHPSGQNLPCL